ncbi:MAG TPA: dienelactone hydrolase family protein [Stackebrandtia sp.]|uniref:dienelactone hydrolase family protein n=1 Tax=Stackebrandtia sp. TaxID=2023065 RepID=UPI002D598566|nr:dienelactone hydrolase family protein [Stackebrandtia sp.]HZE41805.1 dienelactone hydrolase family protein [Stackebrandtia sp.]
MDVTFDVVTERVALHVDDSESSMDALVARPDTDGRYPGVVVGFEIFGVTPYIQRMAERVAAAGYVAIVPDFYHRFGEGIVLSTDERERGLELAGSLSRQQALADVTAALEFLAESPYSTGEAAMLGFSFGGHIAYLAATRLDLRAAVAFYPGWLTSDGIALSRPEPTVESSKEISGRVLVLVGEDDHVIDAVQRRVIADQLGDRGEVVVYPDAPHGFACDDRETFHETSDKDAWDRVWRLLGDAFV